MAKKTDWRDDEKWRLIWHAPERFKQRPDDKPPKEAEIANDPKWCSLYQDNIIIATWLRADYEPSDARV